MAQRWQSSHGVLLLGACVIGMSFSFMLLHVTGPSDGTRFEPDAPVWSQSGIAITPLERLPMGGLRQGDVVLAVAGRSMDAWARLLVDPAVSRPVWRVGDVVPYTVLRGGHQTQIAVTLARYPLGAVLREEWGSLIFALAFALIAAFVFLRRPTERAARPLFLAACCLLSAQTWSFGLQVSDLVDPLGFWLYQLTALGAYTLFWAALLHFALTFPRPHPLVRRWRWIVPAVYLSPVVYLLAYLFATSAISSNTLEWIGTWTPGQGIMGFVYFGAAILVVLDTLRTSRDPVTRRQIRWVVFAGVVSGGAGLILSIVPGDVFGHALISTNQLGLVLLPIPLALAFAILRYRLFDIDVIIRRTLIYGTLTAVLAGIYAAVVFAAQLVGEHLTGQTALPPWLIVITTLLIAALFNPLRQRLQVLIDRRFYRSKYDAARTIETFARSLRGELDLTGLSAQLVDVVETTMQPSYLALWLRSPSTRDDVSSPGTGIP